MFGAHWTYTAIRRCGPPTVKEVSDFDHAFIDAVAAVDEVYVHVPIAGAAPVIRERAFAYELYHQLRSSRAITGYTLTGELEKAAHPRLRDAEVKRLAPDLLLHVPGSNGRNFVAIEIKGGSPRLDRLRKDLASLCLLRDRFDYKRLIYLVFGITERQKQNLPGRMRGVRKQREQPADLHSIELWVQLEGERTPENVQWSAQ